MEIWASQLSVATEAISKIGASADEIASIGITNQRETTVVWNRETGMPIYNAIVWQCRRTAERIDQLKEDGLTDYVKETTGLIPDAYFSASKVAWILDHVEGARKQAENGDLAFGTIDTWLMFIEQMGEELPELAQEEERRVMGAVEEQGIATNPSAEVAICLLMCASDAAAAGDRNAATTIRCGRAT